MRGSLPPLAIYLRGKMPEHRDNFILITAVIKWLKL